MTGCIFGPVPSRRLGASLGIDPVPYKTCSFDCIYCQLGRTTNKTVERREYVPASEIASELKEFFRNPPQVDYITLSGSGEPTLNSSMGQIIEDARRYRKPVAVLTNSSLLADKDVSEAAAKADLVVPTLSTADQKIFEVIHRPHPGILVDEIIESLRGFKENYGTRMFLEAFMLQGINDGEKAVKELRKAIDRISPDLVQVNTVARPPSEGYAKAVPEKQLLRIASILGGEAVASCGKRQSRGFSADTEKTIVDMLRRRPCTLRDVSDSAGLHVNEAAKYLERLEAGGKIRRSKEMGEYYRAAGK